MDTKSIDYLNRNSRFIYTISKHTSLISCFKKKIIFGDYYVGLSEKTNFHQFKDGSKEIIIIGDAVNVLTSSIDFQNLITESCNIDDIISKEYYLGGKYLIFVRLACDYFLFGDATTSVPIFYNIIDDIVCSFSEYQIAQLQGYEENPEMDKIRRSGDISMAMPYDVTVYKEIKQLLPNHYLCLNTKTCHRFLNSSSSQEIIDSKTAAENTINKIKVLSNYYCSLYNPLCPITSGRDSRSVLAFLLKTNPKTKCYTIVHREFNNDTQDIVNPRQIQTRMGFDYVQIEDENVPDELQAMFDQLLGNKNFSQRTLYIAYSILKNFGHVAIINGDIIGQVGKCSLHRNIPESLAGPRYFRCKLHKHSHLALEPLSNWIAEIKESCEKINLFDLFSVENRLGRWAGMENIIYNLLGVNYLNIFNSRSIIYEWTKIAREERMESMLHLSLIEKIEPQLLSVPFEKDANKFVKLSKSSWGAFYFSSFLKFYYKKLTY